MMHIELAELLRCPERHEETFLVVSTDTMDGRIVTAGTIGCPVCRCEYTIQDGIATFVTEGDAVERPPSDVTVGATAAVIQALLNLSGPGGNVALIGSASLLADDLADLVEGVHFVACNPPSTVDGSPRVSRLCATSSIPLRGSSMRGVVLGGEMGKSPWVAESVRVLLRGTRFVAIGQDACPEGVNQLAAGDGLVVGEKA